jgi:hypothetical protein
MVDICLHGSQETDLRALLLLGRPYMRVALKAAGLSSVTPALGARGSREVEARSSGDQDRLNGVIVSLAAWLDQRSS